MPLSGIWVEGIFVEPGLFSALDVAAHINKNKQRLLYYQLMSMYEWACNYFTVNPLEIFKM